MKLKKLIRKHYKACVQQNAEQQKITWFKILKKSMKHKHTEAVT